MVRGTGAMLMTAVVTSVLFSPTNAPERITATITTVGSLDHVPITARRTATQTSDP
jgi:hypothetical protein